MFTVGSRLWRFLLRSGSRLLRVCRTARLHRAGKERRALAAKAILAQGVTLEAVRQTVAAVLPPEADEVPGLIPYEPHAGLGVEKATAEANISRAVATSLAAHEQK